jgi:3alpha(or 20beta)-hydroxysteroid dehydrogenase
MVVEQKFANKTVVITGGSRGQGAAEARMFAQAGARIVIADVLEAEGSDLVQSIVKTGGTAEYRRLDVTSEQDWRDTVAFAMGRFGSLHVLVNNAGISLRGVDLANTTRSAWDRVLAVNLTGPFLGIQAIAPFIRDSGGGAIINIGSTAGINGHFAAAYSASKWGLRGLTKAAAMEYAGWKIRVNAVHPSIVQTPMVAGSGDFVEAMEYMTPMARSASLEDVASAVMFLASDEASYLTGLDLPVDGGFTELGTYRRVWMRATGRDKPQT